WPHTGTFSWPRTLSALPVGTRTAGPVRHGRGDDHRPQPAGRDQQTPGQDHHYLPRRPEIRYRRYPAPTGAVRRAVDGAGHLLPAHHGLRRRVQPCDLGFHRDTRCPAQSGPALRLLAAVPSAAVEIPAPLTLRALVTARGLLGRIPLIGRQTRDIRCTIR